MIDKILRVCDMPSEIREACIERGYYEEEEMSIENAMREWLAWEIGDGQRGADAARYVAAMAARNYFF